jgi:hypothetical protein
MRLGTKVGAAAILFLAGVAGLGWILAGEGLDRGEKWVSIGGVCFSTVVSVAGLALGWMTWRQGVNDRRAALTVTAGGVGSVGVGGHNGGEIRTDVSGVHLSPAPPSGEASGTHATGAGSVAVGGNNDASITTRVTGPDTTSQP